MCGLGAEMGGRRVVVACAAIAAFGLGLFGGCSPPPGGGDAGDAGETDSGGPTGPSQAEFADEYFSHAYCQDLPKCETKAGLGALAEVLCHPSSDFASTNLPPEDAEGGRYTYDRQQAKTCLEEFRNKPQCEGTLARDASGLFGTSGACTNVFEGQQSPGDDCTNDIECEGTAECVFGKTCPGTCEALAGEGDSCEEDEDCDGDLYCDQDTCATPKSDGASCSSSDECESGLYCGDNDTCTSLPEEKGDACERGLGQDNCPGTLVCVDGSCGDGLEIGDSCGDSTPPCAPGGRCVDEVGECVEVAGPGESCSEGGCVLSHFCDGGTCQPRPMPGEDCSNPPAPFSGDDEQFCFRGACESGTCTLKSKGDECSGGSFLGEDNCEDSYCDDSQNTSTCVDYKSEDAECSSDSECAGDLECREDDSGTERCLPICGVN